MIFESKRPPVSLFINECVRLSEFTTITRTGDRGVWADRHRTQALGVRKRDFDGVQHHLVTHLTVCYGVLDSLEENRGMNLSNGPTICVQAVMAVDNLN
jgi:hypothetical protein